MNNFVLAVFAIISCSFYITSGAAIGGCNLPPARFRQAYPPPLKIVGDIFKDISLKDSDGELVYLKLKCNHVIYNDNQA